MLALSFFFIYGCSNIQPPLMTSKLLLGENNRISGYYNINTTWWTKFNDRQLNKIMSIAINNNENLLISSTNIRKSLYQANLLRSNLLPDISAFSSINMKKYVNQRNEDTTSFTSEGMINYEIDIWHKLSDSSFSGKLEYHATVEDYYAAQLTLINSVIDSYFYLTYLNSAINAINDKIKYYDELVKKTQIKLYYGKVSSFDLQKSMQSLLSARQSYFLLQQERYEFQQNLNNFLNIRSENLHWIKFPNILSCKTHKIDLNIPLSVLANRPDVKSAEYRFKKCFYDTIAVEKELYPSITIDFGISSSEAMNTSLNFPIYVANIKLNLPFLNWNKIKWNIKISELDYNIAKIKFEAIINTALNELNFAYSNYKNAVESYKNSSNLYKADVKIENYYRLRYENGSNDITDWLSAAAASTDTKLNMLKNYFEVIKYEVMIYKAMAGEYTLK